jgi:hypothetical protein
VSELAEAFSNRGQTARLVGTGGKMRCRVHRLDLKMTSDQGKLEQFLNGLEGEVVAIIPNVTLGLNWAHRVDFLLIVEKLA